MKLLHVITSLSSGGAERSLYNILANGMEKHCETTVLSLQDAGNYGPKIKLLGIPVYTLNMGRALPTPYAICRLRQLIKNLRPDIIQGWMYHGNLAAWLAVRFAAKKPALAWNIRHSLYDLESEKLMTRQVIRANRWLAKSVDALLYNSHLSRQQHKAFGFPDTRGQVIPNGFALDEWRPNRIDKMIKRRELSIPHNALVIGHVARYHPIKDHVRFVRAAVRVAKLRSDVHVILVGRDVNQDNKALYSLIPNDIKSRFHMFGEREDICQLMRAMDVFCQSSWSEAFPNVLGEAMASGVPCVATDVGDSALIVGDTGIIVPPKDENLLSEALMSLLEKTLLGQEGMAQAARHRIEVNFSLDAVVNQYSHLYKNLSMLKGNH